MWRKKYQVQSPIVIFFNTSSALSGILQAQEAWELCSHELHIEFSLVASIFCTPCSLHHPDQYR